MVIFEGFSGFTGLKGRVSVGYGVIGIWIGFYDFSDFMMVQFGILRF